MKWFKVPNGSWHVVRDTAAGGQLLRSLCGRYEKAVQFDEPHPNEKSCESCLRLVARKVDAAE